MKSKQAHTSTVEHLLRLWFDSNAEAQSMAVPDLQPAAAWIHLEFGRDGVDRNQCRNQLATTNRAALHLLLACKANASVYRRIAHGSECRGPATSKQYLKEHEQWYEWTDGVGLGP